MMAPLPLLLKNILEFDMGWPITSTSIILGDSTLIFLLLRASLFMLFNVSAQFRC